MKLVLLLAIFMVLLGALVTLSQMVSIEQIKSKYFSRNVEQILVNSSRQRFNIKFLRYIEDLITKSNVRFYMPFYNVYIHIVLMVLGFIIFYQSNYLPGTEAIQLSFGFVGVILPFAALNVLASIMENRVKRQSIVFLQGLRNYFKTHNDIFKSFEMVAIALPQPLASYTKSLVMHHKAKLSQVKCLTDFQRNVGFTSDLGLFIDNLKLAIVEGSDIEKLIDEYVHDIEVITEQDDDFRADEIMTSIMVYIFVLILFVGIKYTYTMDYTKDVTGFWWHQLAVISTIYASIFIIFKTLRR